MKKLTALEKFVWDNQHRRFCDLASELNRSEIEIEKAYLRAYRKIRQNNPNSKN